jgi:metal-sulfur cluster biosynthetic enzyme
MTVGTGVTRGEVENAIATVIDPCSIAMGRPLTLVEMGLVEGIEIEGGSVTVKLVLTDPMCFLQADLFRAVEDAVSDLPGVDECVVEVDGDVLWTPDRMRGGGGRHRRSA